ncbi:hypothetical protein HELRODRAFT_78854, partial [Helobdella robusta]|uniref:polynucleotide adenylyltransferase n=1 Tax=Helobdella robusta TaxID=6412 RepID=T1G3G3_HELRO
MSPKPEERYMRSDVVSRMQIVIKSIWPNAEVKVYGSFETGLYLATSDIDLVVYCNELDTQAALTLLEQRLQNIRDYDDVPIVKVLDKQTAVRVDICFNVDSGTSSAEFIKDMMLVYPELKYLVLVMKQFLLSHKLLEMFNGGISSYCLILLIISYLQLHPEDRHSENHGDRLVKFLELYGRLFNYLKCGISVKEGGFYFRKSEEGKGDTTNRYSLLCIKDPFNDENDVGEGCFGIVQIRVEFEKAFRELSDGVLPQYAHIQPTSTSLLGRILTIAPEVVTYRKFI